jgi:hypothetical protein
MFRIRALGRYRHRVQDLEAGKVEQRRRLGMPATEFRWKPTKDEKMDQLGLD